MEASSQSRISIFWRPLLCSFMFCCWLIEGLSYPYSTYADGIAYLDIARACGLGNWQALINGYWSPGYPFLLSCWFAIVKPSSYNELRWAHVFNALTLILAFWCLEYLLTGLLLFQNSKKTEAHEVTLSAQPLRTVG